MGANVPTAWLAPVVDVVVAPAEAEYRLTWNRLELVRTRGMAGLARAMQREHPRANIRCGRKRLLGAG